MNNDFTSKLYVSCQITRFMLRWANAKFWSTLLDVMKQINVRSSLKWEFTILANTFDFGYATFY